MTNPNETKKKERKKRKKVRMPTKCDALLLFEDEPDYNLLRRLGVLALFNQLVSGLSRPFEEICELPLIGVERLRAPDRGSEYFHRRSFKQITAEFTWHTFHGGSVSIKGWVLFLNEHEAGSEGFGPSTF